MTTYVEKLKSFEKNVNIEKKGITITVSGSSGSGKTTVSRAIANELGLDHISVGDIFRALAKERSVSIEEFASQTGKDADFEADVETLSLAMKGNVVLNGRLTAWVAGDNADVKVYVDCDFDVKSERVAKRENKTIEEAKKDLIERDQANNKRYLEHYNIDTDNLEIYDLVIRNNNITMDELRKLSVNMVSELLKKKGLIK